MYESLVFPPIFELEPTSAGNKTKLASLPDVPTRASVQAQSGLMVPKHYIV